MNKATKNILLKYVLGPLVFMALLYLIYLQIIARGSIEQQWLMLKHQAKNAQPFWLFIVIILAIANWSCEAAKWQFLLKNIYPISFLKAFKSILTGIAFSTITPNRVGEFAGKILFIDNKHKLKASFASFTGSLAQMCTMSILGLAGLIFYISFFKANYLLPMIVVGVVVLIVGFVLFFNLEWVNLWKPKRRIFRKIKTGLRIMSRYSRRDLFKLLLYSFVRVSIFNVQNVLLLIYFGADISFLEGFLISALGFWLMAAIPSISISELAVRGAVGVNIFEKSGLVKAPLIVLAGSYTLWIINLLLPSVIGLFLIFTINKKQTPLKSRM